MNGFTLHAEIESVLDLADGFTPRGVAIKRIKRLIDEARIMPRGQSNTRMYFVRGRPFEFRPRLTRAHWLGSKTFGWSVWISACGICLLVRREWSR